MSCWHRLNPFFSPVRPSFWHLLDRLSTFMWQPLDAILTAFWPPFDAMFSTMLDRVEWGFPVLTLLKQLWLKPFWSQFDGLWPLFLTPVRPSFWHRWPPFDRLSTFMWHPLDVILTALLPHFDTMFSTMRDRVEWGFSVLTLLKQLWSHFEVILTAFGPSFWHPFDFILAPSFDAVSTFFWYPLGTLLIALWTYFDTFFFASREMAWGEVYSHLTLLKSFDLWHHVDTFNKSLSTFVWHPLDRLLAVGWHPFNLFGNLLTPFWPTFHRVFTAFCHPFLEHAGRMYSERFCGKCLRFVFSSFFIPRIYWPSVFVAVVCETPSPIHETPTSTQN